MQEVHFELQFGLTTLVILVTRKQTSETVVTTSRREGLYVRLDRLQCVRTLRFEGSKRESRLATGMSSGRESR